MSSSLHLCLFVLATLALGVHAQFPDICKKLPAADNNTISAECPMLCHTEHSTDVTCSFHTNNTEVSGAHPRPMTPHFQSSPHKVASGTKTSMSVKMMPKHSSNQSDNYLCVSTEQVTLTASPYKNRSQCALCRFHTLHDDVALYRAQINCSALASKTYNAHSMLLIESFVANKTIGPDTLQNTWLFLVPANLHRADAHLSKLVLDVIVNMKGVAYDIHSIFDH